MRVFARTGALLGLALAISACVPLFSKDDPERLYKLNAPALASSPDKAASWQLAVEEPVASGGLNTSRIALRPTPNEIRYFAGARWALPAPEMLQTLLIDTFERSAQLPGVGRPGASLRPDFLLHTELRDFQAEFGNSDRPSRVRVTLVAQLIARDGRRVVGSRRISGEQASDANSVAGVVEAFDSQLQPLLAELAEWVLSCGEQLQAGGDAGVCQP